jgi:hypothetical protein
MVSSMEKILLHPRGSMDGHPLVIRPLREESVGLWYNQDVVISQLLTI